MSHGIVGSGLAAWLVADGLKAQGVSPTWMLVGSRLGRGSDAQTALLHPYPGRSMKPPPLLARAWKIAETSINKWQKQFPHLIRQAPMIRPLLPPGGPRFSESFTVNPSPIQGLQVSRLSPKQLQNEYPWVPHEKGAVIYGPTHAVDLKELLCEKQRHANFCISGEAISIEQVAGEWEVHTKHGVLPRVKQLVLCMGHGLHPWFPSLPLGSYGGDLIQVKPLAPRSAFISMNGTHVAIHGSGDWVIGATRWRLSEIKEKVEAESIQILRNRVQDLILGAEDLEVVHHFRGVRFIYDVDRLPISGPVPGQNGLFVFGALGSKGLLWGPIAAQELLRNLIEGKTISPLLSTKRIPESKWKMQKQILK